MIPLIAALLLANEYRQEIFGLDMPVRVFTAIAPPILGWRLARRRADARGAVPAQDDADEVIVRIAAAPAAQAGGDGASADES